MDKQQIDVGGSPLKGFNGHFLFGILKNAAGLLIISQHTLLFSTSTIGFLLQNNIRRLIIDLLGCHSY